MSSFPGDSIVEFPRERSLEEEYLEALRRQQEREQGPNPMALAAARRAGARSAAPTVIQNIEAQILAAEAERGRAESRQTIQGLMTTLPLAYHKFNEMFAGISPLTGYREIWEIASQTSPGEVLDVFTALIEGDIDRSNRIFAEIASRSETAVRQRGLRESAIGGAVQGFGDALATGIELGPELINTFPEDFREATSLDALANGIFFVTDRMQEDVRRFAEHKDAEALAFGLSPEDVIGSKVVGGFVGYTPILISGFKIAEIFPFARGAGFRPFALRDLTAGMILGLGAEGDIGERLEAAASEAAFFGAWSMALGGFGIPIKSFRMRRLAQKLSKKQMERLVREINQAYDPNTGTFRFENLTGLEGKKIFQVFSEENALAHSQQGRRILSQTTTEAGLVPALLDLAQGEATHGVIRGIKNPDDLVPELEKLFPGIEFKTVKRELGADVIFGHGRMSKETLQAFQREGRAIGQRVLVAGQEMEFLGRLRGGRLRARRIDTGNEVPGGVPEELVTDLPFGSFGKPTKRVREAVSEFTDQYFNRIKQVINKRGSMTREEIIEAAREGRLPELGLSPQTRREMVMEGVIGAPEGMGVRPQQIPPERIAQIIAEEGLETFHVRGPAEPTTFRGLVERFADRQGLLEREILGIEYAGRVSEGSVAELGERVTSAMAGLKDEFRAFIVREMRPDVDTKWRMTFMRAEDNTPVGRIHSNDLNELVEIAENPLMAARQVDIASRLTPESEAFLRQLQAEAVKSVRQRAWQQVPKQERRLLEEMRNEVLRVLEDKGPSLERDAALAGVSVKRLPGNRVELREVNTGYSAEFTNEQAAREALEGIQRRLGNDIGPSLTPRFADETPFTSHLPPADDFFLPDQPEAGRLLKTLTDNPKWINLRRWAQEFEERTGLPMWSQVFSPLDEGQQAMQQAAEPWLKRVMGIWKDLSREERAALDPFFQEIAGKELSQAKMIGIAQNLGLSGKQFRAAKAALELERAMFEVTPLPRFRYLDNHFARIRPVAEEGQLPKKVADLIPEELPQRAEAFWQKARTQELSQREKDPLLVQLKYVRSVFFDDHVRGPWERARAIIGDASDPFNLSNLSQTQASRLVNTFVDREGVGKAHRVMREILGRARGIPAEGERSVSRFFKRLVDKLELDIAPELLEEASQIVMSTMYGAAMGARPRMTARNLTQNLWFSWMRLDSDVLGPALKEAMTMPGWKKARAAGSLRPQQRGVFAGEAVLEGHLSRLPEKGQFQLASNAVARKLFDFGEGFRKTSSVAMVPFGASDDFNRTWAHIAQERHIRKYLQQLKEGKISRSKFVDEGMRGHSATTKREFARRFDLMGEDEAVRFLAKQHADEAHFLYARSAQPLWLQGDVGKFGGMFGTYSLWSKDYLYTLIRDMTVGQRMRTLAKGAAFGSAIFLIAEEMGLNLNNWLSPLAAFSFTGGPPTEMVLIARDIIESASYRPENIPNALARLGHEQARLAYPLQGLQHDIWQAGEYAESLDMQILSLLMGRPEKLRGDFFNETLLPYEDALAGRVRTPVDQVLESLDLPEVLPPLEP